MRIAIADDSSLFREGLEMQLTRSGQQVVATARAGDELLALTGRHHIDAAILDVRMPPTFTDEGLRTAEKLAARHPEVGILLLSAYAETAYAERLFADGTERRGYLLKDQVDNAAALCDALERICRGESVVDDLIVKRLLRRQESRNELADLTERERLVLQYMAEGRSNAGIAGIMYISEKTVEAYVARIFTKLGLPGAGDTNRRVLAVLSWLRTHHSGIHARPTFLAPPLGVGRTTGMCRGQSASGSPVGRGPGHGPATGRKFWEKRPAIAGDVVHRVPRYLAACQPVSPIRPWRTAPAPSFGHTPGHAKGPSPCRERASDLRKLVAGAGFEPATSGL